MCSGRKAGREGRAERRKEQQRAPLRRWAGAMEVVGCNARVVARSSQPTARRR